MRLFSLTGAGKNLAPFYVFGSWFSTQILECVAVLLLWISYGVIHVVWWAHTVMGKRTQLDLNLSLEPS